MQSRSWIKEELGSSAYDGVMGILQARPCVLSSVLSGRGTGKGWWGPVGKGSDTRTPLFLFGCEERVCAGGHLLLRRRKFANLVETEEAAGEEVRAWACKVGERRW